MVLLALWVFYYLSVLLKTGFISDDAYTSQIRGMLIQQGVTLHESILSQISGWIFGAGRFLILGWYMAYVTYYNTQDTVIVKALTLTIIVAGIILFYFFSKRETKSSSMALLACFIIPAFFQFRLWHDPILAFTFVLPTIFTLTMAALVLFQQYLDKGGLHHLIGAAVLFLMPLLTYEIAYPLCLLFIIVAYNRSHSIFSAIRQSLPFSIPVMFLLIMVLLIRMNLAANHVQSTYPGAELHLDISSLFSAFEIQASSTIPLSYYYFNKENLATQLYSIDYLFLALFGVGIAMLIYKIGTAEIAPRLSSWISCGIVLLFVSAALASLSGHQVELNQIGFGFGYITVYLQYFGLCIFTVSLLALIAKKVKGRWLIVLAIIISAGITVIAAKNLQLNRAVALKSNETYQYPRHIIKSALNAGIADEMTSGAFLFRTMRYPSDWMWFYSGITNKKIETCELSDAEGYKTCIAKIQPAAAYSSPNKSNSKFEELDLSNQQAWISSYNFEKKSGTTGRVILGKIDRVFQNNVSKTPIQIIVSQLKVYDLKQNQIQTLNLKDAPIDFLKIVADQTTDMSEVKPLDTNALRASDVGFEWLGKVYAREGTDNSNLRWSSGSATLMLHNLTDKPKQVDVTMELGTPSPSMSHLSVESSGKVQTMALDQARTTYSKTLLLPPGSTEIKLTSDGKPIQNGDPRNIVFGIFNFKITNKF
jgi:hypothetical protein